jgi:hypothetical protein
MDVVAVETGTAGRGFLPVTESRHQHHRRPKIDKVGCVGEEVGPESSDLAPATQRRPQAIALSHRLCAVTTAAGAGPHPRTSLAAEPMLTRRRRPPPPRTQAL